MCSEDELTGYEQRGVRNVRVGTCDEVESPTQAL